MNQEGYNMGAKGVPLDISSAAVLVTLTIASCGLVGFLLPTGTDDNSTKTSILEYVGVMLSISKPQEKQRSVDFPEQVLFTLPKGVSLFKRRTQEKTSGNKNSQGKNGDYITNVLEHRSPTVRGK